MQDRFKFRLIVEKGYKTINGSFKGIQVYYCNGFLQGKTKTTFFGNGKKYSFLNSQIKHINQSTGLKDKNGKLIYEGDIVRESFGETGTYRVEYFPYSAEWQYVNLDDEKPNWEMFSIQFEGMSENQGISTDLEIIGNIYENPELIGGAKC